MNLRLALSAALSMAGCAYSNDTGPASDETARIAADLPEHVSWSDFRMLGGSEEARDGSSWPEADALGGTEKVRNGSNINFFNLTGNSTVMIQSETGSICTAQVINRFFLLTAAHCIGEVIPTGEAVVAVTFTNTAGQPFVVGGGPAQGVAIPNWRQGDNDVGLLLFPNGLNTCHDTFANCRNSQVNVPVNAMFQVFHPGFTFAKTSYAFVGYGSTDNQGGAGIARIGTIAATSSFFTDNGNAHMISTSWSEDRQARPCKGDSGGPLIITNFARLLHVGIHSSNSDCRNTSGAPSWAGLTNAQATWIFETMASINPPFRCTIGATVAPGGVGNILAFACDNDGTVF